MASRFETAEVYDRFYTGRSRDVVWTIYENKYRTRTPKDLTATGVNSVRVVAFQDGNASLTINETLTVLTAAADLVDNVACRVSGRVEFGTGDPTGDWIMQVELLLDDGAGGDDYEIVGGQREVTVFDGGPLS